MAAGLTMSPKQSRGARSPSEDLAREAERTAQALHQLSQRIMALLESAQTPARATKANTSDRQWYRTTAGRFANDPVFDEMVRLGREYRVKPEPKPRQRQRKRVKKAADTRA